MTLRSRYFDDWKGGPIVLLWGETTDMRVLRDFLRSVFGPSNTPPLDSFCEAVDGRTITVRAVSDERDSGMHLAGGGLEWKLRPDLAETYADMVDALVASASGHQYLDAPGSDITVDITVEVSIGEYPETFAQAIK